MTDPVPAPKAGTAVWNVLLPVIANIEARTPDQAVAVLRAALDRAGFHIFDGGDEFIFEAESGTPVTELPRLVRLATSRARTGGCDTGYAGPAPRTDRGTRSR
ncbi:hypothetical protein ACWC5I_14350 [Kitasatospora sp. NPDC001574]